MSSLHPRYRYVVGFVLARRNFGEADRIIQFFSLEEGRNSYVARGVRKNLARLAGKLELPTLLKLRLVRGRGLDIIIGVEVVGKMTSQTHQILDLYKAQSLYLIQELTAKTTPEVQPNEKVFELLDCVYNVVILNIDNSLLQLYFIWHLLQALGVGLSLPDVTKQVFFDFKNSDFIGSDASEGCWLQILDIELLQKISDLNIVNLEISKNELIRCNNLRDQLLSYICYHFSLNLRSTKIL